MDDDRKPQRKKIKVLLNEPSISPTTTRTDPLRISSLLNSQPTISIYDGEETALTTPPSVYQQSAITPLPSVTQANYVPPKIPIAIATPVMVVNNHNIPNLRILEEPDPYQISNYKIQPTFTIDLQYAPDSSCIMKVELLDCRTHQVVQKAFVSGDLQPVVTDAKSVTFSKLKLNRMKQLKEETEKYAIIIKDSSFYLRVSMGQSQIASNPFRIVSTFNQLPKEYQSLRNSRSTKAFEKS